MLYGGMLSEFSTNKDGALPLKCPVAIVYLLLQKKE